MILDQMELRKILPQAYPFLMIDRVEDIKVGESLVAIKNITANEWPFQGCGQHSNVYPPTLLIEAAAQAALVLYHVSRVKSLVDMPKYILGRIESEFSGPIVIGDRLNIYAKGNKMLFEGGYSEIQLLVDKNIQAEILVIYSVVRENAKRK